MSITKDNTDKFFKEVKNKVSSGLKTATLMVERDAKIFCPVDTGTLKRSITHEFISDTEAQVGTNVEYAPFVELGTSKMSARPFLRPALAKNIKTIKRLFKAK
ncbi:hypothetical protein LCGC14_0930920 [marine sediment metagenome]|uniref:HK97 gp10 family phage protein n=1 Tax=marine sediment metagenome TaxID=412755 RepID=A0A0F9RUI7_9ZZZZ